MGESSKKRVEWVDIAKFLTIILVITAHHNSFGEYVKTGINAFHMPLFFFASGLFFRQKGIIPAIKKGAKAYLLPYIIVSIASAILAGPVNLLVFGKLDTVRENAISILKDSFVYVTGWGMNWFLLCLFTTTILMEVGFALFHKEWVRMVVVLLANIISIFDIPYSLFFQIRPACMALLFVYVGYLCRRYCIEDGEIKESLLSSIGMKLAALCAILLMAVCIWNKTSINIACKSYPFYPLCVFEAFAGILLICWFSVFLSRHAWFGKSFSCRMGKETLYIYIVHSMEMSLVPWYYFNARINELVGPARIAMVLLFFLVHVGTVLLISYGAIWCRDYLKSRKAR